MEHQYQLAPGGMDHWFQLLHLYSECFQLSFSTLYLMCLALRRCLMFHTGQEHVPPYGSGQGDWPQRCAIYL
ncbi:hypothetical protein HZH66_002414 [Vespula vulgaris]|uniref:Uncharacterized protein n=1 Tax=Vespula vulgaris TaxID=7454 RepID=A0A834KL32_VESVU|nr:hypothetical protein HZH66_002414 [Vespula vulgaris]